MAKFSVFDDDDDDDDAPSSQKIRKRSRLSTSESSCSEEPSRAKRRSDHHYGDADQIHQNEESCPDYQEEEGEEEQEQEQQQEQQQQQVEEEEEEPSVSANPYNENIKSPAVNTDKSISAIFTDADVLDCGICFEPLTIPVFQCENGHIACSSCCNGCRNKCPSCSWPIGYNRCRAIEKVLESVKIPCKHKKYGCDQTVIYSNKKHHESNCPYIPCSCPESFCGFVSSDKKLYSHFNSEHRVTATGFTYGVDFRATLDVAARFLVLREALEGVLFVLNFRVETIGFAIWLSCISSPVSSMTFGYAVSARNEDDFLKLRSVAKSTRGVCDNCPPNGFLLVPFGFSGMASSRNLSFDLCISQSNRDVQC